MKKAKACEKRLCLGNVKGQCFADSCRGAIVRLAKKERTPEQAREIYELAASLWDDYSEEVGMKCDEPE